MLKILLITLIAALIPLLGYSGDSYSIKLSCTIPVIPGVNAPLVNDNANKAEADNAEAQEESNSSTTFESDEEDMRLVKGETQTVAVKTIYSQ